MLYKFKSQVAAEVIMLQPDAETLLKIIGKTPGAQGIVTVAQVPAALQALRQAIEARKLAAVKAAASGKAVADDEEGADDDGIPLERRAGPFMHLLEHSAAAGKDVVWGV